MLFFHLWRYLIIILWREFWISIYLCALIVNICFILVHSDWQLNWALIFPYAWFQTSSNLPRVFFLRFNSIWFWCLSRVKYCTNLLIKFFFGYLALLVNSLWNRMQCIQLSNINGEYKRVDNWILTSISLVCLQYPDPMKFFCVNVFTNTWETFFLWCSVAVAAVVQLDNNSAAKIIKNI